MSDFDQYTAVPEAPSGTPSAEERQWGMFALTIFYTGIWSAGALRYF